MGTTTPHGLPYPENNDLVTQGAATIQALAEAVDDELGAWTTFTPTVAGIPGTVGRAKYLKRGNSVLVQFQMVASGASGAQFELTPPVVPAAITQDQAIGIGNVFDVSVPGGQQATVMLTTKPLAADMRIVLYASGSTYVGISNPWAWTNGDVVRFTCEYEVPT